MKLKFQKIWKLALPYLKQGKRKNFVIHTKGVIKAMELILKKEMGDENILMTAAILHDTGWSKVPVELQKGNDKNKILKAMQLHIKFAPFAIKEILNKIDYDKNQIKKIINIVLSHKFKNPKNKNKQLLIDADALSDIFKEQFYSDAKAYKISPQKNLEIRKANKFYTKTAQEIFGKELKKREKEIKKIIMPSGRIELPSQPSEGRILSIKL